MPVDKNFVTDYGASTNGQYRNNVAFTISMSTPTILDASAPIFASGDVGKGLALRGGGDPGSPAPPSCAAGTSMVVMNRTIAGFTSATRVTLSSPAFCPMTNRVTPILWGTNCDAAMNSWISDATANPGSTLRIPAGAYFLSASVCPNVYPIRDCQIIGAGSGVTFFNKLSFNTFGPVLMSRSDVGRIQTAVAGANKVVLLSPALSSRFTVGNYICVTGYSNQAIFGFPPTFGWTEYHKILSINSTTGEIFLDSSVLAHDYLQTWPEIDSCQFTWAGFGASETVITMVRHGLYFNTLVTEDSNIFFLDTNGVGTMPANMTTLTGVTWSAHDHTIDTFKFSFQNDPNVKVSDAGSGVVLHRSGIEQGGPAMIYPMVTAWDSHHQGSGITIDPCEGIGGPGFVRQLTLDDVNVPGGYGPTVMKLFTHKNSTIGADSGTPEIDKMMDTVVYDNITTPQIYYQNCTVSILRNCNITFLNGVGKDMTIENCTIGSLGWGVNGAGQTLRGRVSNSNIGSVSQGSSLANKDFFIFEAIPSTPSFGRFKVRAFSGAGSDYNPNRIIYFQAFLPGMHYRYGFSDGASQFLSPNVSFQITNMYQDTMWNYADTTLAFPQPDISVDGLTFLTWINHGTAIQAVGYVPYSPEQISLVGNTGAGAAHLADFAFQTVPFDTVVSNAAFAKIRLRG